MKKINAFLFALLAILFTVACNNQGLKKTKSGLLYKIISDGKNPVVKKGQFVKFNFEQRLQYAGKNTDSVLFNSATALPAYVPIDTSTVANYSPVEIFRFLRKGDSAVVIMTGDSIEKKAGRLPPFIGKKDRILLTLRVLDVLDNDMAVQKDRQSVLDAFHAREAKEVADFIAKNNINAQKTEKGTYVKVDNVGDGPAVDSGKQISVIYTGKLFPSGKVFETNDGKEPIKFVLGRMSVIPGWDDGLRLFKKGGSGTLYVPAFLAYDDRQGPGKTPNENLIFDIRIVDVADAPVEKPSSMPHGMPMPMPMPGKGRAVPTRPAK